MFHSKSITRKYFEIYCTLFHTKGKKFSLLSRAINVNRHFKFANTNHLNNQSLSYNRTKLWRGSLPLSSHTIEIVSYLNTCIFFLFKAIDKVTFQDGFVEMFRLRHSSVLTLNSLAWVTERKITGGSQINGFRFNEQIWYLQLSCTRVIKKCVDFCHNFFSTRHISLRFGTHIWTTNLVILRKYATFCYAVLKYYFW